MNNPRRGLCSSVTSRFWARAEREARVADPEEELLPVERHVLEAALIGVLLLGIGVAYWLLG